MARANVEQHPATGNTLIVMVGLILVESLRQWFGILSGRKEAQTKESPFVVTRLAEEQV